MTGVKGSYCIPRIFEVCLDGSDRYLQIDTYRDRPIYIYMCTYIYVFIYLSIYEPSGGTKTRISFVKGTF